MKDKRGNEKVLKMKESVLKRGEEDEKNHCEERIRWTFSTLNKSYYTKMSSHLSIMAVKL